MSDLISRKAAIELIHSLYPSEPIMRMNRKRWKKKYEPYIETEKALEMLPAAEPEINKQKLIRTMNAGIIATNTEDVYSCGMRNGIRWCKALLEDDSPKFEDASQYAEQEIIRCKDCEHWIPYDWMFSEVWQSKNMEDYPEDEIGCNCCDMAMGADDFCSRAERKGNG